MHVHDLHAKNKLQINIPEKMVKQRRIPVKGVMLLFNFPVEMIQLAVLRSIYVQV